MPEIISVGDTDEKDLKQNPLKAYWEKFQSLDKFTKLLIFTIIGFAIFAAYISTNLLETRQRAEAPPRNTLVMGMSIREGSPYWGTMTPTNFSSAIEGIKSDMGRYPGSISIWQQFRGPGDGQGPYNTFPKGLFEVLSQKVNSNGIGITPVIFFQTVGSGPSDLYTNSSIAGTNPSGPYTGNQGSFDDQLRTWAASASAYQQPIIFRLDQEMNGNWFPWSEGNNGNTAGSYIAMWRHMHDIITSIAPNVKFFWCPNGGDAPNYYPGEQYVDYVGFDKYIWNKSGAPGFGPHDHYDSYQNMKAAYTGGINSLLKYNKPIIIGETGIAATWPDSGTTDHNDRESWITSGYTDIFNNFDKVLGIIYFNIDVNPREHVDWSLAGNMKAAYASLMADPRFAGNFFSGNTFTPSPTTITPTVPPPPTSLPNIFAAYGLNDSTQVPLAKSIGLNFGQSSAASNSATGVAYTANGMKQIYGLTTYLYRRICYRVKNETPNIYNGLSDNSICKTAYYANPANQFSNDNDYYSAAQSAIDNAKNNPNLGAFYMLDDWFFGSPWIGSAKSYLQQVNSYIHSNVPGVPSICAFAGGTLDENGYNWNSNRADIFKNFSPTGCDIVGIYTYVKNNTIPVDVSKVDWTMNGLIKIEKDTLAAQGWDSSKTPLIGIPQAFGGLYGSGQTYATPSAQMVEIQSRSWCQAGAKGLLFYTWNDSSNGSGNDHETLSNSPALRQGAQNGINDCKQILGGGAPPPPPPPPTNSVKIYPTDDASVISNQATKNFGNNTTIVVDGNPKALAYLKFDLSSLSGKTITAVKLHLRVASYTGAGSNAIFSIKPSTLYWNQSSINYNNKPALGSAIATLTKPKKETDYYIDLTNYFSTPQNIVSFGIDTQSRDGAIFRSKEMSSIAKRPYLQINYK